MVHRPQIFHLSKIPGWWFQSLCKNIIYSVGIIIPDIWKNKKSSKPPKPVLILQPRPRYLVGLPEVYRKNMENHHFCTINHQTFLEMPMSNMSNMSKSFQVQGSGCPCPSTTPRKFHAKGKLAVLTCHGNFLRLVKGISQYINVYHMCI